LRIVAAQRKEGLLTESRDTLGRLRRYHEARVELGAIPEVDLIKVELEAERAEISLASAQMETERAKIDLFSGRCRASDAVEEVAKCNFLPSRDAQLVNLVFDRPLE
jgi:outer membrane protein TolC